MAGVMIAKFAAAGWRSGNVSTVRCLAASVAPIAVHFLALQGRKAALVAPISGSIPSRREISAVVVDFTSRHST
jgi:hypothetical protein